ncbi:ribose 5-phosphate isomerase B [Candidatus Omnitrophota bacterium]
MKKILVASDHAGFALKEKLKVYLKAKGLSVIDLGTDSPESCDYPLFARDLARKISKTASRRGILICKSGIGNSIVANRFSGVRAALCCSAKAARLSREHNDSNVLVLGSAFASEDLAKRILNTWLKTKFLGGRHKRRIKIISKIEKEIRIRR